MNRQTTLMEEEQIEKKEMQNYLLLLEEMNQLSETEITIVNAYAKGFADRGKLLKKGA